MQASDPLKLFFQQEVRNAFEGKLGLRDQGVNGYVTNVLCEFALTSNLFSVRSPSGRSIYIHDESGSPVETLSDMARAADPVLGTAASFDEERAIRKHIGDAALFIASMWPQSTDPDLRHRPPITQASDLMRVGRESYRIVSEFNLFEYESQAPLFRSLADEFGRCVLGLTLVREAFVHAELNPRKLLNPPPPG